MSNKEELENLGVEWYDWFDKDTNIEKILDLINTEGVTVKDINHIFDLLRNDFNVATFLRCYYNIVKGYRQYLQVRYLMKDGNPIFEVLDYLDGKYNTFIASESDGSITMESLSYTKEKEKEYEATLT